MTQLPRQSDAERRIEANLRRAERLMKFALIVIALAVVCITIAVVLRLTHAR